MFPGQGRRTECHDAAVRMTVHIDLFPCAAATASTTAATSSYSRSKLYSEASPLAPRPRRSKLRRWVNRSSTPAKASPNPRRRLSAARPVRSSLARGVVTRGLQIRNGSRAVCQPGPVQAFVANRSHPHREATRPGRRAGQVHAHPAADLGQQRRGGLCGTASCSASSTPGGGAAGLSLRQPESRR
jgi:hypothetical protein